MSLSLRPHHRFPVPCAVTYHADPFHPLLPAYFSGFWSQKEGHTPRRSAPDLHEMYARLGGGCPCRPPPAYQYHHFPPHPALRFNRAPLRMGRPARSLCPSRPAYHVQ